ncbi:MAG: hypothetical protein AAGM84_15930 [Pseudomonadota bacterium]
MKIFDRVAWISKVLSCLTCTLFTFCFVTFAVAEEPALKMIKNSSDNRILLVFVHGIRSDAEDAWTNPRTRAYWPELIAADASLEHINVATFQYPASALSRDGLRINEVGRNLKVFLDVQMQRHDQVVFVAHSMGGLVVRSMLLNYRESFDTPLAIFLAVPVAGSDLANWARALGLGANNAFVQGLEPLQQNDTLESWISQWAAWTSTGKPRVLCAYERVRTAGVFVVEQANMLQGCDDVPLGVAANHSDIAKPSGSDALIYQFVAAALQSMNAETFVPRLKGDVRLTDASLFQGKPVIAHTISLDADVWLPPRAQIFAHNVFLNGHKLIGHDLAILADTVSDGVIQSASSEAGGEAGDLVIVAQRLSGVELNAMGSDGSPGRDGRHGTAGANGNAGRKGNCDGFGKWRAAQAGGNGGNGAAGGNGENGGDGGDGGRIFIATVLQSGVLTNVAAGRGGPAGQGGQGGPGGTGGPGGRGCTGLGGTQGNAATGRDGTDGVDGRNGLPGGDGRTGQVWRAELSSLPALRAVSSMPASDSLADYADVLFEDLKSDVRLAASQ